MKKTELQPGDRVRIVTREKPQKLGPTLWEVTDVSGFFCMIREAGTNYVAQQFDTSLLKRVSQ